MFFSFVFQIFLGLRDYRVSNKETVFFSNITNSLVKIYEKSFEQAWIRIVIMFGNRD